VKKTPICVSLIIVLSIFGSTQTAAAFERNAQERHAAKEPRKSYEEHLSQREAGPGLKKDPSRRDVHAQRPPRYEHHLPEGFRTLRIANRVLYYLNGIFYQLTPYGYAMVNAPLGAVVGELPPGYYQILYRGTIYYVYNNTYYAQVPMGYSVVTPPPMIMLPTQVGW